MKHHLQEIQCYKCHYPTGAFRNSVSFYSGMEVYCKDCVNEVENLIVVQDEDNNKPPMA